jgi:hypothetical protein
VAFTLYSSINEYFATTWDFTLTTERRPRRS